MNILIDSIFCGISESAHSHSSAFVWVYANQLRSVGHEVTVCLAKGGYLDWEGFDEVHLWQGLALNGKLTHNVYLDNRDRCIDTLVRLSSTRARVLPILYPFFGDVIGYLERRYWIRQDPRDAQINWEELKHRVDPPTGNPAGMEKATHLCLGDSHMLAAWWPGTHLSVNSGMTMHHLVTQGFPELDYGAYESVTLYFGNIDVRHHLCRQLDPFRAARELVERYLGMVVEWGISKVELVKLLPIETEARDVPQIGWYKGTPFYGSWSQRTELVRFINDLLVQEATRQKARGKRWYAYSWPDFFTNPAGELDPFVMERPRGVHIAPQFYRANRVRLLADGVTFETENLIP